VYGWQSDKIVTVGGGCLQVTTPGHMTIYRRRPKASRSTVNRPFGRLAGGRLSLLRWAAFGHPPALEEVTDVGTKGEMKCSD